MKLFNRNSLTLSPEGFTLIELLIVLVIVGLLMLVAIPSYHSFIQSENRSLAQQALIACMANIIEQKTKLGSFESLFDRYQGEQLSELCRLQVPVQGNRHYQIDLVKFDGNKTFVLEAIPQSRLAREDGRLTLSDRGEGCRITGGDHCLSW